MQSFNDKEIDLLREMAYAEEQRLAGEHAQRCKKFAKTNPNVLSLTACQKSAKPCSLAIKAHRMEKIHNKLYEIWEARW